MYEQLELAIAETKLVYLVDEAKEFIHEHYDRELGFIPYAFSGGKDSILLEHILRSTGLPIKGHYVNTTIEPPEVLKFVHEHYPEVEIIKAPPFFKMMRKKGFPRRMARWCCSTQKKDPAPKYKTPTFCGIRASESKARAKRGRITTGKYGNINPVFYFLDTDVWKYIRQNNIAYPHLYDEGFDRLGCTVCPMISENKVPIHMQQWPKHWAAYKATFRYVWLKKSETLESYKNLNWETAYERFLKGGAIFDSKHDERQMDFEYDEMMMEFEEII